MFSFLYKHKNGILGTLLFHLVLINVFFIVRMSTTQDLDSSEILIEFDNQKANYEEIVKRAIENDPVISNNINYTNYAYNLAKLKKVEENLYKNNTEENIGEIDKELVNKVLRDALGEEDYKKYIESNEKRKKNDEKPKDEEDKKIEQQIQHIIKDGPSTLIYELENRYAVNMPIPVYKCENGGEVKIFIEVSRNGYVSSAKLDVINSKFFDQCLSDAALKAAKSSKFNVDNSAPEIQQGRIIYTFIPQ